MQNYPYLERNTQKLKNHTRRTGLLCKCSHVLWFEIGATYPTPSSFYLLFPYVLAQLICKKTCIQVKAHKHSLSLDFFLLQDCLYAVKRRQKHNIGHTVAHLVSAVLLSYLDIPSNPSGSRGGMNLGGSSAHDSHATLHHLWGLWYFDSWKTWIKSWKKGVGIFAISLR